MLAERASPRSDLANVIPCFDEQKQCKVCLDGIGCCTVDGSYGSGEVCHVGGASLGCPMI